MPEKQYECLACNSKFHGKLEKCPSCGQKQYYCQYANCTKQLDNPNVKYCSEHAFQMHKVKKKVTPIAIVGGIVIFVLTPACVLILVLSKGKINPFLWALTIMGIKK